MQPSCLVSFLSSFPRPSQSPLLPQTPENRGKERGQHLLAQKVCPVCISPDWELCSQGSAVFQAPSCTTLHAIRIQTTLYFHTFQATHLYSRTSWKEPSLPKVFPPQSHPNAGTDPELSFWEQRLQLTEVFLSLNTTRVCLCIKTLLIRAPFRKEIRKLVPVLKYQFCAGMSAIFCCYTHVLL